ncbi:unnamed protein product [marine sediment metagenome]|uniref:Uncharacterized protein n=1 Tax=marine sediment metagenome TaxID=412755 RepID=X0YDH8_9ZZZZ
MRINLFDDVSAELEAEAQRRGLTPLTLARFILSEWLLLESAKRTQSQTNSQPSKKAQAKTKVVEEDTGDGKTE